MTQLPKDPQPNDVQTSVSETPTGETMLQNPPDLPSERLPRNIIFFGETGVGKSSIINMLRERADERFDVVPAEVSNAAIGCTLENTVYKVRLGQEVYHLWDTAGLVEGENGSVSAAQAEKNLKTLLYRMPGGVHLLVYCVRGRRYRSIIKNNYNAFYVEACQRQVPIILAVTGLENEENMEYWWTRNKVEFENRRVYFHSSICMTSTKGKKLKTGGNMFDTEYDESLNAIRTAVMSASQATGYVCSPRPPPKAQRSGYRFQVPWFSLPSHRYSKGREDLNELMPGTLSEPEESGGEDWN